MAGELRQLQAVGDGSSMDCVMALGAESEGRPDQRSTQCHFGSHAPGRYGWSTGDEVWHNGEATEGASRDDRGRSGAKCGALAIDGG